MSRRILVALIPVVTARCLRGDWTPPPVATSWKTYEAAYPKKTMSGAALEIERLSARLGVELAPPAPIVSEEEEGEEKLRRLPPPDDGRERPSPELAKRVLPAVSALGRWVDQELSDPSDRVGPPPPAVADFLEENAATLDSLAAVASGTRPIEWELDVSPGIEARLPNLLGQLRLQRILAARALLQARAREPDAALATMDGMWALTGSLAEQPYLVAQLIVAAQLRLVVGLLRKIDAPAFGWDERLARRAFYEGFLVALQNDPWPAAKDPDMAPSIETLARVYRRFVDGLVARSPCDWTSESLEQSWEVAASGESGTDQILAAIASDSIVDMVRRWQRLLVDSDFSAVVLRARAEKAASRQGEWPPRFVNPESSVCPGRFYSYRRAGGVTIVLEGTLPPEDRQGLVLPLVFRGAPPPTPTPTATSVHPTPTRPASGP